MLDDFDGGTVLRAQFAKKHVLFVLRAGERADGQMRSLMYRIVLPDDPGGTPAIEITMDYDGWLTDFWRHDSKTYFLANSEGDLYVVNTDSFRGFQPQERGVTQIHGRSLNDVWAVAISGTIMHWDGEEWRIVGPENSDALMAIGETTGGRILAVGEMGRVLIQSGPGWQTVEAPTNVRLTAVGHMQGATYIGGEHGICYRLGEELDLTPVAGPSFGTYGFADYAGKGLSASQADGIMQIDGDELVPFAHPLQPYGLAVCGDLMVAYGDDNLAVFDGTRWHMIDLDAV